MRPTTTTSTASGQRGKRLVKEVPPLFSSPILLAKYKAEQNEKDPPTVSS